MTYRPTAQDTPRSTPDRHELVCWLIDNCWEIVKEKLIEDGASPVVYVYSLFSWDTDWLRTHFPDDRIAQIMGGMTTDEYIKACDDTRKMTDGERTVRGLQQIEGKRLLYKASSE